RLLSVEDNTANQLVLTGLLAGFDCHIDTASNGQEALKRVEQQQYHLIFMDIQMPRMDGVETTRRLRQVPGYRTIPVIGVSASLLDSESGDYTQLGFNDWLLKPYSGDALATLVEKWLPEAKRSAQRIPHAADRLEAAPKEPPSVLDPGVLIALQKLYPKDQRKELLRLMEASTQTVATLCEALQRAISHSDRDQISRLSHSLTSTAGNLGARRLATLNTQISRLIKFDDIQQVSRLSSQLEEESAAVQLAVEQWLRRL
ncbi:MAG: response regulator, partial [Gammaproteobacteria bacterium]